MPKGPPVHEIFNHPASGKSKDAHFHYQKKESKVQSQLTPKKTLAPLPPMKKYGGYKPKILGGSDDVVPITNNKPRPPSPPVEKRRPPSALTKPKPFVIGDKNIPMVLSTVHGDADSDSNSDDIPNGIEEVHIYEEPPMYMSSGGNDIQVNNNDLNNINNNVSGNHNGMLNMFNQSEDSFAHRNTHSHSTEAFAVANENENLVNKNHTEKDPTLFATENPVFNATDITSDADDSRIENESEPEGVFIPAPDYDEEERTMDFDDEEPDEMVDEEQLARIQKQRRLQQLHKDQQDGTKMRVYDGEDLSKYLSDDEDDVHIDNVNKSGTMPVRLNQKHSLFKTNPQSNTAKRKTSKKQAQKFNSVRNFSFADSKYATSGKASGKKSGGGGDYENFLSTSQQGEGYEDFLRSKHGVGTDSPAAGHKGYRPQHNGKAGDGIWKKLTVRLKHKRQKNGYDMQEQF